MQRATIGKPLCATFSFAVGLLAFSIASAAEPTEEAVEKPIYLHWFKPYYVGNDSPPMHLLSLRITPSVEFDVDFIDPSFKTRKCTIKGRIDKRGERYVGDVEGIWKSGTKFAGEFQLEKPASGQPLGFASAYHSTSIALSQQRSPKRFVTVASSPVLIEEQPASQSVITGQFIVPTGHRITGILDGSSGGRVFLQCSGFQLNASIGVGPDGRFRYVVRNVREALHADTAVYVCATLDGFSQRSYGPFKLTELPLDMGKLNLETGFTATIRVEDPQGQPIKGAVVQSAEMELKGGTTRQTKTVLGLQGRSSDAKGLLRLNHVSSIPIVLTLAKSQFVAAKRTVIPKANVTIPWTLVPGDDVLGRLVDADGKAVEGAEIHFVRSDGEDTLHSDPRTDFRQNPDRTRSNRTPLAMSDADGRFRLHTLRKGTRHWLMALHTNHRPTWFSVTVNQPLAPITLHKPIVVSGRIEGDLSQLPTRRDGQPYLRASNLEKESGRVNSTSFYVNIDPKGQFVITQLFPGSLSFRRPSATGTKQIRTLDIADSISDVVIKLD